MKDFAAIDFETANGYPCYRAIISRGSVEKFA
jgi:hypothetical protein